MPKIRFIPQSEPGAPVPGAAPDTPVADVKALARSHTNMAIGALVAIVQNPRALDSVRASAAATLLSRGWGSPESSSSITIKTDARELSSDELAAIVVGVAPLQPTQH